MQKFKKVSYLLSGALFFPLGAYALYKLVIELAELNAYASEPLHFMFILFCFLSILLAAVTCWADILTRNFDLNEQPYKLLNIFRSEWLVYKIWWLLPGGVMVFLLSKLTG